ncbi:MAG: fatty acid desaturase [Acidimicrobiia bacterium]|nr:fatty acid desaturase [Acidimicrobiia bacterium]
MSVTIANVLEGQPSRDYSLVGPESERAVERGLADAEWFRPHVDPARVAELMERTNARAIADAALWFALLIGLGVAAVLSIGAWFAIPLFLAYGALYGGSADARWHEYGHGTAARSNAVNNTVYYLSSFFLLRGPTLWRWSHFRHHSDTIIVGRDREIQVPRPSTIRRFLLNYTNLVNAPRALAQFGRHATGRIDPETRDFVPEQELRKVVWEARVFLAILAAVVAVSLALGSIVPLLLIGLPSIYGTWLMVFFGATQHLGLQEDVLDHRANTRTVYMNPVFRFLYLNMNYHIEHHMFPAVPYYRLPALHAEIKDALPEPNPSMWSAYRELVGEMWRQRRDPTDELQGRTIPDVPAATGQGINHAVGTPIADGRFDLGSLDGLAPGMIRSAEIDGLDLVLVRDLGGNVFVLDGICTHGHAHLAHGALVDACIECPKHNGRFDLATGAPVRRPVRMPLGTYDVAIDGGRIITTLTLQRPPGTTPERILDTTRGTPP